MSETVDADGDQLRALEERVIELQRALALSRQQLDLERLKLRQTEAALWQMATLVGAAPFGVLLMDAHGVITDVNHEAERLLGMRREKILGLTLRELVEPSRRGTVDGLLDRVRAGEMIRGVERRLWPEQAKPLGDTGVMFPIHGPNGDVVGAALTEDVQEIKDMRTLLADANVELAQLAVVDGLTGLTNRRGYEQAIDREVRRAARRGEPLSVAMLDVDDFKAFNDSFGHSRGDQCLRAIARALDGAARRAGDLVARYGGEEFVAVLPGVDHRRACIMAERLRRAVEHLGIVNPASQHGVVTVSVGVVTIVPRRQQGGLELVAAADRALYLAKENGRNRVEAVDLGAPGLTTEAGAGSERASDDGGSR
ncbi:MAG: diguanylate cyclase [Planctomycetes bacterium]|nr:diguanylate cyclase [Planctomycetota bacterium]